MEPVAVCPAGLCWPVAGSAAVAQPIAGCILPSGRCAVEVAAIWSPWHYFARCLCLPWSSALIAIVRSRSCLPDGQCPSWRLPQCSGCLGFHSRLLICQDGYWKNLYSFCLQGLFFCRAVPQGAACPYQAHYPNLLSLFLVVLGGLYRSRYAFQP